MDVTATRQFNAPPTEVAKVMFDPTRDPEWIGGAQAVDPPTGDATRIGAHVTRHGGFLGKKFSWTTEVISFELDHLLDLRFIAGPMKGGGVTYRIEPNKEGSLVSVRNTGPGPGPIGWFVKRSVSKDLERLARLVER
jgi:uncharacterized protein YndB with AHSA1/START domain